MVDLFAVGVRDEEYERGDVPMTKREVRAVTMAYARVSHESHVLDIGAGTGGLTVEFARACAGGRVVAVERDEEALALLRVNAERLAPGNVEIIAGDAPEVLSRVIGPFDAVLVGGHGGKLAEVCAAAAGLLTAGGHVVVNAVGLGAVSKALEIIQAPPWVDAECAQISVSRAEPLGRDIRFVPLNPVFVLAARLARKMAR
ncbi:MAG: precorrin-6Y C5,15-methyltransferase (decarboxylating) subunit CbiT [Thermoleophilia bacterium]